MSPPRATRDEERNAQRACDELEAQAKSLTRRILSAMSNTDGIDWFEVGWLCRQLADAAARLDEPTTALADEEPRIETRADE